MVCIETDLFPGESITSGLFLIELHSPPDSDGVKIKVTSSCFLGGRISFYNIGSVREVYCEDGTQAGCKIKYIKRVGDDGVNLEICDGLTPPPAKECSDYTSQSTCEANGCYWYNNACHPNPQDQPPEDLTDYQRIRSDMEDIVSPLVWMIDGVDNLLSDTKSVVDSIYKSLPVEIKGLLSDVTEVVDSLGDKLSLEISNSTGVLTDGLQTVSDEIRSLEFPTVDSIKQAFLDVCFDLAMALWDTILEKIEERYPDDEEEV